MRQWILLILLAALLTACSAKREVPEGGAANFSAPRVDHERAAGVAYEHEVELEVPASHTRQVFDAVQQACAALPEHGCTLLGASIRSGTMPSADVRMRVTPDGVNKVLRSLDGHGKVVEQSTKGEDLAEPIHDGERKMAMLTAYRDRLQALAAQRAMEPDALIKLNRALAEVQSEIDTAATSQAQLRRRVDTELLAVAMHEPWAAGQAGGIKRAMEDFGGDFLHGVAMLITFVASTIPFAVAGIIGYLVWRRVRSARRRAASMPDRR